MTTPIGSLPNDELISTVAGPIRITSFNKTIDFVSSNLTEIVTLTSADATITNDLTVTRDINVGRNVAVTNTLTVNKVTTNETLIDFSHKDLGNIFNVDCERINATTGILADFIDDLVEGNGVTVDGLLILDNKINNPDSTVAANRLYNGSIWNVPLGGSAPTTGQSLVYNGTNVAWSTAATGAADRIFNGTTWNLAFSGPAPTSGQSLTFDGTNIIWSTTSGGNVSGPVTSTDHAVPIWDGAGGSHIINSTLIYDPDISTLSLPTSGVVKTNTINTVSGNTVSFSTANIGSIGLATANIFRASTSVQSPLYTAVVGDVFIKTAANAISCQTTAGSTTINLHVASGTVDCTNVDADGQIATPTIITQSGDLTLTPNGSNVVVTSGKQLQLQAVSDQIKFGLVATTTITCPLPSGGRVYTIPDAGVNSEFFMAAGSQTIPGTPVFTGDPKFSGTGTNNVLEGKTTGESQPRVAIKADGSINFGAGSGFFTDTVLRRVDTNVLAINNNGDTVAGKLDVGSIVNGTTEVKLVETGEIQFKPTTYSLFNMPLDENYILISPDDAANADNYTMQALAGTFKGYSAVTFNGWFDSDGGGTVRFDSLKPSFSVAADFRDTAASFIISTFTGANNFTSMVIEANTGPGPVFPEGIKFP